MDIVVEKNEDKIKQQTNDAGMHEEKKETGQEQMLSIRILLVGPAEQALKRHSDEILKKANDFGAIIKEPGSLPYKKATITTRKTPCGQGSKTWDRYELRVYRKYVDTQCTMSVLRELVSFKPDQRVKVVILVRESEE